MLKKIVLAPDSFKGTLSASDVCDIWEGCIRARLPRAQAVRFPVADGGEGLSQAYYNILGGEFVSVPVHNALGEPIDAAYVILPDGTAVIEMAAAAGLPMVSDRNDPLRANTFGVGELLLDAARRGVTNAILGLGGSATNDCGAGMAAALGFSFLDASGAAVEPAAANLARVSRIIPPAQPVSLRVTAACDVDNPLCGPNGATYTYGPQKGVLPGQLRTLDAGLAHFAQVLEHMVHRNVKDVPGAGAAGGLGAGVLAFLGGALKPGVELLMDTAGFDRLLDGADLVLTGEGRIDGQSAHGKVPVGVARRARRHGVPCVALCGSMAKGAEAAYAEGVTAIFTTVNRTAPVSEILASAGEDMRFLTDAVLRLLSAAECGAEIQAAQITADATRLL